MLVFLCIVLIVLTVIILPLRAQFSVSADLIELKAEVRVRLFFFNVFEAVFAIEETNDGSGELKLLPVIKRGGKTSVMIKSGGGESEEKPDKKKRKQKPGFIRKLIVKAAKRFLRAFNLLEAELDALIGFSENAALTAESAAVVKIAAETAGAYIANRYSKLLKKNIGCSFNEDALKFSIGGIISISFTDYMFVGT